MTRSEKSGCCKLPKSKVGKAKWLPLKDANKFGMHLNHHFDLSTLILTFYSVRITTFNR